MGAQVILCDGFEVVPPPDMSDHILFGTDQSSGSNCDESTITTEVFSRDSSPGGAPEEECPEPKPFSFYFVKQHPYDDTHIKAKINEADAEIYHCNKRRIDISITQKSARASLPSMYAQMESLGSKSEGCKAVYEEKKREFDSLQEGLRCSSTDQLCFSKEELDHLVYMARYVSEHGSIGFEDEDWLLKETDKHDAMSLSEESFAEKDAFIHRVKSMAVELNEVKKELEAITWNINQLSDKMGQIQNKIMVLDAEMAHVLDHRDKSYEKIKMLRKLRDKGNAEFFQSIAVMRKAKELAASGNVRDLEVYASSEVDKFMTRWSNDKGYRDDYVKGISFSLCERQLSQDGRVRDHEGELVHDKKALVNNGKEGEVIHEMNVITDKEKKEARNEEKGFNKPSAEESDVTDLDFPVYEKEEVDEETLKERKREEVDEETLKERKREEVDEETLKERKREEELEKARFAMERKRKLQEKAAAKAAIRAQKEAEKKLKECEKKAKKKAAATLTELDQAMNEMEEVSTLAVSGKERQRSTCPKKRSFRYKHRVRGTEAIPKAILNRRKARKYWRWGLWSAALALSLFLLFLLLK